MGLGLGCDLVLIFPGEFNAVTIGRVRQIGPIPETQGVGGRTTVDGPILHGPAVWPVVVAPPFSMPGRFVDREVSSRCWWRAAGFRSWLPQDCWLGAWLLHGARRTSRRRSLRRWATVLSPPSRAGSASIRIRPFTSRRTSGRHLQPTVAGSRSASISRPARAVGSSSVMLSPRYPSPTR
jgi:hypothetical protein